MPRPVSDWAAQDRGYHQHKQMIAAHEKEEAKKWSNNRADMNKLKSMFDDTTDGGAPPAATKGRSDGRNPHT